MKPRTVNRHTDNLPQWRPWLKWLSPAAVAVIYILFRAHSLPIPLDRDEGIFGYAGQQIVEGGKLYRDVVDHKPPGVFYIYAFALHFFPATPVGMHLFLAIYNFLTLLAVSLLLRIRFRRTQAWLGGAFCYAVFSASPAIQGFTASTEMLMLLPITLSVLLAVSGKKERHPVLITLSGAAGAAAFWIKQTAATSVAFALLYLIATPWFDEETDNPRSDSVRQRIRDVALWVAGAAILSAAVAGYFYFTGLFSQFVYWSFTHNVEYAAEISISTTAFLLKETLQEIVRGDFVIIGLGIAGALWNWKRRRSGSLFVLGFLAFSLVGTLPGFAYPHYFAQLAPAVALASGWALSTIPGRRSQTAKAWLFVLIVSIAIVPLWVHRDYFVELTPVAFSRQFFGVNPFAESAELSAFLAARTTEQDRVFVFGSEPQILFQAGRKSATPFAMIYPLTHSYPRYLEFQEQVWHDIQLSRPAYVILVDISTSILWDGQAKLEITGHLNDLLKTQYQLAAVLPMRQNEVPSKLLVVTEGQNLPPDIATQNQPNIYVYHRTQGHS